ncbi:hypothetical protein V3C99_018465, partial [Haemonchus contortus]|uniref:Protein kinase domain-containing protein n=1 Tax=Haemonchus contortus TaxID=6289 RepID=A0A7I5EE77_HAECO
PKAAIRNKYFNIPSLESRRKLFDLCMIHNLLTGKTAAGSKLVCKIIGCPRTVDGKLVENVAPCYRESAVHDEIWAISCSFIDAGIVCKNNRLQIIRQ